MEKITFTGKNFNDTTLRTRKEAEEIKEKIAKKYLDQRFYGGSPDGSYHFILKIKS